MTVDQRPVPTERDIRDILARGRNWDRWGPDDERGALNHITPQSRLRAVAAARTGQSISLSRPFPTWTGAGNLQPAEHYMKMRNNGGNNANVDTGGDTTPGGWATDYYGISYHGVTTTHMDALCHVWDGDGVYGGRDPEEVITYDGALTCGIEKWADGVFTRGVLLDVPQHRGTAYVDEDSPVMGWELEDIVAAKGIALQPGDALLVYCGRERWQAANPDKPYGRFPVTYLPGCATQNFTKPGLHASCLAFLADHDPSTLVWDMLDATPYPYDMPFAVHSAIHAFGTALVDNALLEPLATACAEQDRTDFLFTVAPLVVNGGTGSPVNPIVIL